MSPGRTLCSGYPLGPLMIDTLAEAIALAVGGLSVAFAALPLLGLLAWRQATIVARLVQFGTSDE